MVTGAPPVVIIGTGGFAVELAGLVRGDGLNVLGFIGPGPDRSLPGRHLGDDDDLDQTPGESILLIAIGDPAIRRRIAGRIAALDRQMARFVHAAAWVADDAEIGEGAIIYPNSTVHSAVSLGRGVLVNSNATVGHETVVGDFCNIGPGAALGGRTTLGEAIHVGIGATLIEKLNIASGAIIGAGATVIGHIPSAGTYVGTPARPLES